MNFDPNLVGAPDDGVIHWIHAEDGVRLRLAYWERDKNSKGTIFFFPGRSDYIEQYGRTVTMLGQYGYATLIIDWRGQGLSDRETKDRRTGHVNRFSDYQKDVLAMQSFAYSHDLPQPWFLLGHSMGGCIGLRSLIDGLPVSACAFTAPMWGIHLSPAVRTAAPPILWVMQTLGFGHIYAPGFSGESYVLKTAFEDNTLTNDYDMYEYWRSLAQRLPDQQVGGPSIGWLYQALNETKTLSEQSSPKIPCIVFCGDEEKIVCVESIQNRMARWANGGLELLNNAKHEILLETSDIREKVVRDICELFSTV